ncbi:MAG: response regulator transcription factor [Pseudomonadota bacterium]|nr:response regulator transcription factor [Pseudomonadota bacterium]
MSETVRAGLDDASPHLLVVDDDRRIRLLLSRYLADHGFRITTAESAAEARGKLKGLVFDLLILDVMMPGESGIELTRALRAETNVPILMLTARAETEQRISGLESGADDYLSKPFDPRELVLRINSILRRAQPSQARSEELRVGDLVYNVERGELRRGAELIRLTERERELMRLLCEKPGETVPRMALAGEGEGANERAVDVQINRLRRKIERDPANPVLLQTVRGIGYKLLAG